MALTLNDIAAMAGVSLGTASKYVNGLPVKQANADRLEKAIRETGYRPNTSARRLRSNRTNTIGIVARNFTDAFSAHISAGIQRQLARVGYAALYTFYGIGENEEETIRLLLDKQVDGLVVFPSGGIDSYEGLIPQSMPVVVLDRPVEPRRYVNITADNCPDMEGVGRHLRQMGHSAVLALGESRGNPVYADRMDGLCKGLGEAARVDYIAVMGAQEAYSAVNSFVFDPAGPTAIVALGYYHTLGALMALQNRGLSIPRDISVAGHDYQFAQDVFNYDLCAVNQPVDDIAALCCSQLASQIQGKHEEKLSIHRLQSAFVAGDTVKDIT